MGTHTISPPRRQSSSAPSRKLRVSPFMVLARARRTMACRPCERLLASRALPAGAGPCTRDFRDVHKALRRHGGGSGRGRDRATIRLAGAAHVRYPIRSRPRATSCFGPGADLKLISLAYVLPRLKAPSIEKNVGHSLRYSNRCSVHVNFKCWQYD